MALDIKDFRGIRRLAKDQMPLTGDIILIYGPNGVGKTSIAESIEWALTGQVYRLKEAQSEVSEHSPDPIVNVFSSEGLVRVTCHLSNGDEVCREVCGQRKKQTVNDETMNDYRGMIDYVAGSEAHSGEGRLETEQLRDLFRGSHMLWQHNIRQFLEKTTPNDRFDILTNMIGAEAFVRLRKKVATVGRSLSSNVSSKREQVKSLNRDLDHQRTQLDQRKGDLKSLSESITSGKAVDNLITEMVEMLQKSGCTVDEVAFDKAVSDPTAKRLDFITVTVETVIRSKRVANMDLEVRLKSLERDWQGYAEARNWCADLRSKIEEAKDSAKKSRIKLQEQETERHNLQIHIQNLQDKRSGAVEKHTSLTWMKENLPTYTQYRSAFRSKKESIVETRDKIQKFEDELEQLRKESDCKKTRMEEAEQETNHRKSRQQRLDSLMQRLPQAQGQQHEIKELEKKETQLLTQVNELKQQQSVVKNDMDSAREQLTKLQSLYDSEASRHEELSAILAKLAEIVRSAECPLCGRDFASRDEAEKTIGEHLTALPHQLKDLARQLDTAKSRAEGKQNDFNLIGDKIHAHESELNQVSSRKTGTGSMVGQFTSDCLALEVTLSADDSSTWHKGILEAKSKIAVEPISLEAARLKKDIAELLPRIIDQNNTLTLLRRDLQVTEDECDALKRAVQKLSAEMTERGFAPDSIPDSVILAVSLQKSEDAVRESMSLITESEAALTAAESLIVELKESISKADEGAASKENQLRQFETTCSRFITACNAAGIDPDNARECIHTAKQRISEANTLLSIVNEKNLILQQVSGLKRLQSEIDDLEHDINETKRQLENCSLEESRFNEWVLCFTRLEEDVVAKQIDIVGTHLESLEPTTQLLYRRLNPHPVFGNLKIRVDENDRQLNFAAESSLLPERLREMAISPTDYFSDAQMNSLAITVFLAGALRQRWSGFRTILIDDPIQQMDELNVYAFIDLIRGLSGDRQFIIFTCSRDFYLLGLERLECLNKVKPGKFLAYRLEGIAPADLKVQCDTKQEGTSSS